MDPEKEGAGSSWPFWGAVASLLAAGAVARAWGIFTDFSLDEVWNARDVLALRSPLGIFTTLTHDNNHPLNSLFVWALGDQPRFWLYRLLSLATGAATPWLLFLFARRYGRGAALSSLFLGGISFLLVEYSSEARGYAPAVFFSLASFLLAERALGSGRWRDHALLWAAAALGILSHSTFLFALGGIIAWAGVRVLEGAGPLAAAGGRFLKLALVPLGAAALHLLWWRGVFIEGGPVFGLGRVLSDLAELALGLPLGWGGTAAVGTVCAGVLAWEIGVSLRKERATGAFFLFSILLCPAVMLLVSRPEWLYPRYFLVCFALGLVLWGRFLGRLAERPGWRRGAAAALLLLYAAGNLVQIGGLVRVGRGQFREAIRYMAEQDKDPVITVTSNHDFRNEMQLTFHSRGLGREIRFIKIKERAVNPPAEWFIAHSLDPRDRFDPEFGRIGDTYYHLERTFPSQPPAGITWYLYRRYR